MRRTALAGLVGAASSDLRGCACSDLVAVPEPWVPPRSVAVFAAAELRFDAGASRGLPMRLDPYQVDILDVFEESGVTSVRLLAGAQGGKTTCLLAIIGHGIGEEAAEMIVVQPTERPSAEKFTRQRVDPMIDASAILAERVAGKRSTGKGNSVSMKVFPGGFLSIAGASAPAGLASMPAGILLADEIDKWPRAVGARGAKEAGMVEGEPLMLARRRLHGYAGTAREMLVSTPTTVEGNIWLGWEEGDRCVWVVPCPHCGHAAAMTWGDHKLQPGHGETAHVVRQHDGRGACMTCGGCGEAWSRSERIRAARAGRWKPTSTPTKRGARSFYLWRAMSSWGAGLDAAWEERETAERKAREGNPVPIREWRQGVLGVPSQNDAEDFPAVVEFRRQIARKVLAAREAGNAWVPDGLVHTGAVDVQADCLHVACVGWKGTGAGWILDRATFEGEPSDASDDCWRDARAWFVERKCRAVNIDSGFLADVVDEIVTAWGAGAAQIKGRGMDGSDTPGPFVRPPALPEAQTGAVDRKKMRRGPAHVRRMNPLWTIGTTTGKRALFARLARNVGDPLAILPGAWMSAADVAELISEHEVDVVNERTGRVRKRWVSCNGKVNHLLDAVLYSWHAWRRLRLAGRRK